MWLSGWWSLGSVFLLTIVILVQTTSYIILLASTSYSSLPPYIIRQARDNATSPTTTNTIQRHPQPTSTVWRHSPRDGRRRGEVSRQNNRKKRNKVFRWLGATREENGSEFAGCKKNPPVMVTREGGVSLPRLAERGCDAPEGGGARES